MDWQRWKDQPPLGGVPGAVRALATPTDRSEMAVLAVRVRISGCTLDLFGLESGAAQFGRRFMGPMLYVIRGEQLADDAIRLLRRALRWWATHLESRPLGGSANAGRPRGSYKGMPRSPREIRAWYREAAREYALDGSQPTLRDLADWLGVATAKTARRRLRDAGLSWPPV